MFGGGANGVLGGLGGLYNPVLQDLSDRQQQIDCPFIGKAPHILTYGMEGLEGLREGSMSTITYVPLKEKKEMQTQQGLNTLRSPFAGTTLDELLPTETKKKESYMNSFKQYLDKHRDMIFTIALVFVADHYILGGALKERLRKLLEGILTKAESNLHKEISS